MTSFTDFFTSGLFIVQDPQTMKPSIPILTDPWREFWDLALPDAENPIASNICLFVTKKAGKSTFLAALHAYIATHYSDVTTIISANSKEQSTGRSHAQLSYSLKNSPLKNQAEIQRFNIKFSNRSEVIAVSADGSSMAGHNAVLLTADEIWGIISPNDQIRWAESVPPPGGASFRVVASYAGIQGQSAVLRNLWDVLQKGEKVHDKYPIYHNKDADVFGVIDGENDEYFFRLPWVDENYLSKMSKAERPTHYKRLWLNKWASADGELICSSQHWDSLKSIEVTPIQAGDIEPLYFGLDASTARASTALVGVSPHEDFVDVRYVRVWSPKQSKAIKGNKKVVDLSEVEEEIVSLYERGAVRALSADPYQLHSVLMNLRKRGLRGKIVEIAQTQTRYKTDALLSDLIQEGRIRHYGSEILREHMGNAHLKETVRGIRLEKQPHGGDIDSVVALAMAAFIAIKKGSLGARPLTQHTHNPFYNQEERLPSPVGMRNEEHKVYVNNNWVSLKTAIQAPQHPPGVTWRTCRYRTKGCPACEAELRRQGFFDSENPQKWIREHW